MKYFALQNRIGMRQHDAKSPLFPTALLLSLSFMATNCVYTEPIVQAKRKQELLCLFALL